MSEFVVRNDVSEKGLKRLHLVQAGERMDIFAMLEKYRIAKEDVKAWLEYEEEELMIWHLRIYWKEE
jgi:hypothetical protein